MSFAFSGGFGMFGVKTWLKERFKTRPAPLSRLSIDCIFRNIDLRKHNMTLTRQEIEAIHRDFVLPYQTHYLSQYSNFDEFEKKYNNKKWNWEGKDFPRCWACLSLTGMQRYMVSDLKGF